MPRAEAPKRRSAEAPKRRSNEATKQRSNEATKQRSNEAPKGAPAIAAFGPARAVREFRAP